MEGNLFTMPSNDLFTKSVAKGFKHKIRQTIIYVNYDIKKAFNVLMDNHIKNESSVYYNIAKSMTLGVNGISVGTDYVVGVLKEKDLFNTNTSHKLITFNHPQL